MKRVEIGTAESVERHRPTSGNKCSAEEAYSIFLQSCANTSEVISTQFSENSSNALIAFAGINGGFAMPPFEFFGSTRGIDAHRFYCRDLSGRWYLDNLPTVGSTFFDLVCYLKKILERLEVRRTVIVGNSAGGYAALLMGLFLKADAVIAFSPQTDLFVSEPFSSSEKVAWEAYSRLRGDSPALFSQLADLNKVFFEAQPKGTQFDIHFSQGNAVDSKHASNLAAFSGVNLIPHLSDGHALVRDLKERGHLTALLERPFLSHKH